MLISPPTAISIPTVEPTAPTAAETDDDGFGFDDLIDVINPLQHIPIVSTLYRAITGDKMEIPAQLAGGALYGGLFGFLGALGSVAFEKITGESPEDMFVSMFDASPSGGDPYRAQRAYASAQALVENELAR